jgi:alkanesulfonate monooxygenase SsuD/methylene tetrahydromethanopterin reductase-like flavin-dependent oxidoreductase (luciferase family)
VKVGIWVDMRNPSTWRRPWAEHYGWTVELIEEAERLDARTVWLSEHHFFDDGYLPQTLTFASAIAARTKRIRIGTSVLLAALPHAIQLAEEAAIVDIMSNGRLDLGLGAGVRRREFDMYGVDFGRRYALFEERIVELRRLWEEVVRPAPLQQPVPMWGGFLGARGARITGRLGLGYVGVASDDSYQPGTPTTPYEAYVAGLKEGAHPLSAHRVALGINMLVVADDPEAVRARIIPHYLYQVNSYAQYTLEGTGQPLPPPQEDAAQLAVLTPDDAAMYIKKLCGGLDVEEAYCWISLGGMPTDLVERHVELLCTKVAPLVGSAEGIARRES